MDNLPKLLPMWHSVTLRETSEKRKSRMPIHIYPDHGGCGIDMQYAENDLHCEELKSSVNVVNFKAKTCALPLLSPNKVHSLADPCLGKLLHEKEKEKRFCSKAFALKQTMRSVSAFRSSILKAVKLIEEGKYGKMKVPPSVVDLAKIFPKTFPTPRAEWSFTGGCLTTLNLASECLLLHPVGKKMNYLGITPLKEKDGPVCIEAEEQKQRKLSLKDGGRIFQISTATSPLIKTDACCVRQRHMYHYVKVYADEEAAVSLHPTETFEFEEELTDVKISNYIPGEHVVVTVGGQLYLQDVEQRQSIWKSHDNLSHDPLVMDAWWGCDFGSHPRSILYCDRFQLTAVDLRAKAPKSLKILSLPNPLFLDIEQIMMTKRLEVNHFQHLLATDSRLLVLDERYPQQPLMAWSHMLESVPLYCDIKPYRFMNNSMELVALLGSQQSQDVVSFHLSSSTSRVQPLSLTHPCHLSSPKDSITSLELQYIGAHDDDVSKRLSMPLIGVCALPHTNGTGYSVIQLTSLGDVFHQDFFLSSDNPQAEKTFRVETGCSLLPASEILPRVSSWFAEAAVPTKRHRSSLPDIFYMYGDREQVLTDLLRCPRAIDCVICKPGDGRQEELDEGDDDAVYSEICPRCGLHTEYSMQLLKVAESLGVLSGPLPRCSYEEEEYGEPASRSLQLVDFDKITDPLSKMVLEEWPNMKAMHSREIAEPCSQATDLGAAFRRSPVLSPVLQHATSAGVSEETSELGPTQSSYASDNFPYSQDLFPSPKRSPALEKSNSQDLFPSPKRIPVLEKYKSKKIKLSSSFGF